MNLGQRKWSTESSADVLVQRWCSTSDRSNRSKANEAALSDRPLLTFPDRLSCRSTPLNVVAFPPSFSWAWQCSFSPRVVSPFSIVYAPTGSERRESPHVNYPRRNWDHAFVCVHGSWSSNGDRSSHRPCWSDRWRCPTRFGVVDGSCLQLSMRMTMTRLCRWWMALVMSKGKGSEGTIHRISSLVDRRQTPEDKSLTGTSSAYRDDSLYCDDRKPSQNVRFSLVDPCDDHRRRHSNHVLPHCSMPC